MTTPDNPGLTPVEQTPVATFPTTTVAPAEPVAAAAPVKEVAPSAAMDEVDLDVGDSTIEQAPGGVPEENVEEDFNFPAAAPRNNATIETVYSSPIAEQLWDELASTVQLPADTAARTLNYGELNPNPEIIEGDAGELWADTVEKGLAAGSLHDNMLPAAMREGADYRQRIMHGNKALSIATPRIADDEGPHLSGERGMLRINAMLGRGSIIQIPLWHSGFWLTLKMPEEVELLDTFDRIITNKINFGRNSNGLAFANHAVIDNGAVVDLAMRCLYETSVAGATTVSKIRSMIKAPDIHTLAWGLACAMNPRGFQFERSILDPKGVRNTVVRENLNVGACLWVDHSSFDEWQISHMAKRQTGSMSQESVALYADHFVRGADKSVALTDKLGLTLRVPSVDEYLTAGQLWVDELIAAVTEAFTQEIDNKTRNEMIWDRARATSMRQYVHWIKSIDALDPKVNKAVVDREWITKTVTSLSGDNEVRNAYYKAMKEFINNSNVSLIGVPQVHPDESSAVMPRFENIIPLDPISVFFSLLSQKIQQIRLRP